MRVSDYVFEYLKEINVNTVYMLSGGGIMYLVDSLGRSGIQYVCCHHEQAASIAAQAHGMYDDNLGVCLVTTGPGGTNALTGCAAAYVDSTPVLYISGQVKTDDFASKRGVRQFGAQENDIISMAKPVCKYAVLVKRAEDIRFELEKCIYMAQNGRKGPTWIDIPLDIQSAEVNPYELIAFEPDDVSQSNNETQIKDAVGYTIELLKNSSKPLMLAGHGVISSGSQGIIEEIHKCTGIPLMSTWRALGIMDYDEKGFYGSPGLQAPRYSNLIIQDCDALIVFGSRLDNMITAFNEEHFAYKAKKVIVDIDENEISKLSMKDIFPVISDVKVYSEYLLGQLSKEDNHLPKYDEWASRCDDIRKKYPILNEKQENNDGVDLYKCTMAISKLTESTDTIVISSTSRCNTAGHIAFKRKKEQKSISSMGMGAMGFALPSVVGAWYASGKSKVIMIEGDGSLQLNIQELETIVSTGIDAKMFIFSNKGYAAITTMQERNFDGFYVGSNEKSGVFMPDIRKISEAYGIKYYCIETDDEIEEMVKKTMFEKSPVICEIYGGLHFDEIPKCISRISEKTGQRESALLENPYPFVEL